MIKNQDVYINGDGETTRDFCYIDNVIQANILAAFSGHSSKDNSFKALNQIYNIAFGERTSLNDLYHIIRDNLSIKFKDLKNNDPIYRDFRVGDVRHSQADISKASSLLGYRPTHNAKDGLLEAMDWYIKSLK